MSARSSTGTELARVGTSTTAVSANSWTRVAAQGVAPAGTATLRVQFNFRSAVVGEAAWVDAISLYESNTDLPYADGASSNWVWNGGAQNSTSTGPAF